MRAVRRILIPVVAVAVAMATVPLQTSAATSLPFRATLTETGGPPGPPTPCGNFGCVTVTGTTGQATHLGAIAESAVVVVDTSTFDPATGCADEIRTSTLTVTNRDPSTNPNREPNRDQITLQGPGRVCGATTQRAGGDSWVVIGGTGRFAGATGSGTNSVTINTATDPVTSVTTFTGTISY